MLKTRKNQKGFTLTELLIVIVIIGILAAVLIPVLTNYVQRAHKSAAEQNAITMYQEFVANAKINNVAVDEEEMAELLAAKYVVRSGDYEVTIERGKLEKSEKVSTATASTSYEYGKVKTESTDTYYTLADLKDGGHIILLENAAYLSALK